MNYEPIQLRAPELETLIEHVTPAPAVGREYWLGRMDATGSEPFMSLIAVGYLPAQIAVANDIPLVFFEEWFEHSVDKVLLKRAMRSCAQVAVARSMAVLRGVPANPGQAMTMKALSERLAWIAERSDPEKWAVRKDTGPPPTPITLNLNFAPSKGKAQVIDVTPNPQKALT